VKITFQAQGKQPVTLADPQRGTGGWTGPYNLRLESERTTAARKYIGARRSFEKSLGNTSGTLSFEAYRTCASIEEAVALAMEYEDTLPHGNGTLTFGKRASDKAAIKNVVTSQTGITVRATLTIALGNIITKI